ncbi:hypothetical protein ACHAPG_002515 [Botrytis cinerea]
MSEILHCGGDETTERQVNSESPQPQNELAADSQQYYPSIAAENPGSELRPRHKQPLAAPILEVDILDLAETPGSTGSMEVNFDCEYDLEAYLEDFSRLARKGKFDSAKDLFESCPSDLKDHPEFVLDFVDTLLKQGAYKTLVGFAADKESSLLKQLSDCGKIPSQYLSSLFELGRQRAFGYLPDDKMKDVWADEVRSELLANFENLDSIQALCSRYGVGDAIELFFKNRKQALSKTVPKSVKLEFSGWFHFVFDWAHRSHGDESTELALLDLLVTISLQLLSHGSQNDPSITKVINQSMAHANQLAISLSLSNPENVQANPYLKWALVNQRLAREAPSNTRQIPDYKYMEQCQGVIIWASNLPIYVPSESHNLIPVQWKRQPRSTPENVLKLGLDNSRKNVDYSLVVQYLQEMFYTSESPLEVLSELSHIQEDMQGDKIGYLQTCLTKYLCASDKTVMESLSNELKEFDEKIRELDSSPRKIDPLTRWCQRSIQAALHVRLYGENLLTNPFLEEQENAYQQLPYDFKRILAELGKESGTHKLNSTDEALPKEFAEPCKRTIYRDGNFIICDSSGYFTSLFEESSHEKVLIEI